MPRYNNPNVQSAPVSIVGAVIWLVMLPVRLMVWFFVIVLMAIFSLE